MQLNFLNVLGVLCGENSTRTPCLPAGLECSENDMDAQQVFTHGQQGLYLLLMVAAPLLLTVLAVGLVVSIFQAATQIHEATLSFVPKIVAAVVVLAVAGPWMLTTLVEYIQRTLQAIPSVVG
jgi:flagellar biosynthetic protein FliQ